MDASEDCIALALTAPMMDVRLWSAEDPYLYSLVVSLSVGRGGMAHAAGVVDDVDEGDGGAMETEEAPVVVEFESLKLGARTACVSEKQLKINGVAVTIKGVNRHEHDPLRGKCVDEESMWRDARMIKATAPRPTPVDWNRRKS